MGAYFVGSNLFCEVWHGKVLRGGRVKSALLATWVVSLPLRVTSWEFSLLKYIRDILVSRCSTVGVTAMLVEVSFLSPCQIEGTKF